MEKCGIKKKIKRQNLKRIILQLENLTEHANSLLTISILLNEKKKKKAVTLMKWSQSKADIVFQYI